MKIGCLVMAQLIVALTFQLMFNQIYLFKFEVKSAFILKKIYTHEKS